MRQIDKGLFCHKLIVNLKAMHIIIYLMLDFMLQWATACIYRDAVTGMQAIESY